MAHPYTCTRCKQKKKCVIDGCATGEKCIPLCLGCARLKPIPPPKPKMKTVVTRGVKWTPVVNLVPGTFAGREDVIASLDMTNEENRYATVQFKTGPGKDEWVIAKLGPNGRETWCVELLTQHGQIYIAPGVSNVIRVMTKVFGDE